MSKISLVVIDDHPIFRQGVVDTFSLEEDLEIVGQASSGKEGLAMVLDLEPLVAVIDVNLPELNGQQLTRELHVRKSTTRVILLTAYNDSDQVVHSMSAGAAAYCSKDIHPVKLVDIVRAVAGGKYVVAEEILDRKGLDRWLDRRIESPNRAFSDPGEPFDPLSKREMEVLDCVTQGMSNKEIAVKLGISHQTVKNHVTAILRKLGVDDRTQAAVFALRRGWVRLYESTEE